MVGKNKDMRREGGHCGISSLWLVYLLFVETPSAAYSAGKSVYSVSNITMVLSQTYLHLSVAVFQGRGGHEMCL